MEEIDEILYNLCRNMNQADRFWGKEIEGCDRMLGMS